MPRNTSIYICDNCAHEYAAWQGKCDECGEWNTIIEQKQSGLATFGGANLVRKSSGGKKGQTSQSIHLGSSLDGVVTKNLQPETLSTVRAIKIERTPTGISELDRVLGGGMAPGSIILLTGEPGVGKSTILMQLAGNLSHKQGVLYISAEESLRQISLRAERVLGSPTDATGNISGDILPGPGYSNDNLQMVNAYSLENILALLLQLNSPDTIILDSIQTISSSQTRGIPGGMAQVKYCASELTSLAKQMGKTLVLVGHINKEGKIAGPKILEHLVDVVLHFSGDEKTNLRTLRSPKNRFFSVDEVGIFLMEEQGLVSLENPGEYFLGEEGGKKGQTGACRSMVLEGARPLVIEVQALTVPTNFPYPKRIAEGIPMPRLQLLTAVLSKYLRAKLHELDIYVNVASGLKVADRAVDLAIASAIISSVNNKPLSSDTVVFGEINLSGRVSSASSQKRRIKECKRLGYKNIVSSDLVRRLGDLPKSLSI